MLTVVSPDLQRLAAGAKVFPKPLRASMRKELTVIARTGQKASKSRIRSMPSGGGRRIDRTRLARFDAGIFTAEAGLRSVIASAIRVTATASTTKGVGVRIYVADTADLEDHRRFRVAQLLDTKGTFAHKVYGRWTTPKQITPGFKYFEQELEKLSPEMRLAAAEAIRVATFATMPNVR